ncbi:hypothetical protein PanWU01x14_314720 [Parasponia andersonii]|uniref:Uncharacterized protein n=1 Tax=Parasponia andersonii TaxID=3476 RepID=A0A2P5ANS1_PARAD|nr:hypothetical protein PanWU01x14_314720 [Parasponia andersonii]
MADLVDYDRLLEFITAGIDALSIDSWDEQNPRSPPGLRRRLRSRTLRQEEEEEEEANVDETEPMDVDGFVELEEDDDDDHFEIQVNENVTTIKFKCMDGRGCEVLVLGGEALFRFL